MPFDVSWFHSYGTQLPASGSSLTVDSSTCNVVPSSLSDVIGLDPVIPLIPILKIFAVLQNVLHPQAQNHYF